MPDRLEEIISRQNKPLEVNTSERENTLTLQCAGAFSLVNHDSLDRLTEQADAAEAKRIILDLRQVSHMDSLGIGTLARILKHTGAAKKALAIVPNDMIRRMLAAASLESVFPLADSLEAAAERLSAS